MSFKALDRIDEVDPPTSAATLLLFILASYAGPDGTCFPSQALLCKRAKLKERAVRDNLGELVAAGLIEVTPCYRKDGTRTSNGYRLLYYTPEQPLAEPGQRVSKRTRPPADIAGGSTHDEALPDKGLRSVEGVPDHRQISPVDYRRLTPGLPAINAGLTTFEPVSEPVGCVDTHPSSACEREARDEVQDRADLVRACFDRVVAAWLAKAPERCSRVKAWPKWVEACEGRDPVDLEAAAVRYLNAPGGEVHRRLCKQLDRWLGEMFFEGWLPGAAPVAGVPGEPPKWAGDPAVRTAVAVLAGEDFAAAYLDPSGWDEAARAVVPRTGTARERLLSRLRPHLQSLNITIAERKPL